MLFKHFLYFKWLLLDIQSILQINFEYQNLAELNADFYRILRIVYIDKNNFRK